MGAAGGPLSLGVLAAIATVLFLMASPATSDSLGQSWAATSSLPTPSLGISCVTSPEYGGVYCVGGTNGVTVTNQVYSSTLSNNGGVGGWTKSGVYPASVDSESCVRFLASVYCIAGSQGGFKYVSTDYFSNLTSTGLGRWVQTTAYPLQAEQQSCLAYQYFVYCVAGNTAFGLKNSTYFATLSSHGIGAWAATAAYPQKLAGESCNAYSGYIYCVGGYNATSGTDAVYSAPLSSSGGIGAWTKTTSYPKTTYSQSCVAYSAHLYCVGGFVQPPGESPTYSSAVYVAPLLGSGGVGAWTQTTAYPSKVEGEDCVATTGYVDCFGGYDGSAFLASGYYAGIVAIATSTTSVYVTQTTTNTTTYQVNFTTTATTTHTALLTWVSTVKVGTTRTVTTTSVSTAVPTSTGSQNQNSLQGYPLGEISLGAGVAIAAIAGVVIVWIRRPLVAK